MRPATLNRRLHPKRDRGGPAVIFDVTNRGVPPIRDVRSAMTHKTAIAVLLLIAVSYTAGASTCAPGLCCESPATISLTSGTAEACCVRVSTVQGSAVSARPGKTDVQASPHATPDLKGIPASDSTPPLARASRRASLQRVVALTETGQAIYLHTGRLRL